MREAPRDLERNRCCTYTKSEEGNILDTQEVEGNLPATSSKQSAEKDSAQETAGQ